MKRHTPVGHVRGPAVHRPAQELLLVQEDAEARGALEQALADEGYLVTGVATAERAAEALVARAFALVLADLPVPEGVEAWRAVEALQEAARPVPVALLTHTWVDPRELRARGLAFGLLQPFDTTSLLVHVAEHAAAEPVPAPLAAAVRAYFDALSRQDWDALLALCAPDVTYHLPGNDPTFSRTVRGCDAFRAFTAETFRAFPGVRFRVESAALLPFGVVARYSVVGPGGEPLPPGAVLLHFEDGRLVRIGVRLEVQAVLAARPLPPSRVA